MKSVYKPNISTTGRWASMVMGAALAAVGYQRSNKMLKSAGLGLLARGATGFCPVSAAIGRDTSGYDTRRRLSGSRGVRAEASIIIDRPQQEVYTYWRQFEHLPKFMDHLSEVRDIDGRRSHWVAKGPLGVNVEWDAQLINDIPPELIAWSTVGPSDVVSAGSVRFLPAGSDHATEVHVRLQYDPPAGRVGATVAWLLGDDPQRAIEEDLRRFKELLEMGQISSEPRKRGRIRRNREASQIMTEPLPIH
jgi:uncharacterized membrane protein